jgi:hypothetical protein
VEQSTPIDAFVAQLVTVPVPDSVPRNRWDVTPVAAATIITAKDYPSWLEPAEIDPALRETARQDLATVIAAHPVLPEVQPAAP